MPATADTPYQEVDRLLDRLHQRHLCGCPDCDPCPLQGGKSKEGAWLRLTMPDGYSMEYVGKTVNECAWKIGRALTDHEAKPKRPTIPVR